MNDKYDCYIGITDWLAERDQPVAITLTEFLEPASGPEAILFPPTYARDDKRADHPYPISVLRQDIPAEAAAAQGLEANVCDLDSVGSQANRMEPALKMPPLNELIPQIVIKTPTGKRISLLDIGHRVADGAIRFSRFSEPAAKAISALDKHGNAAELAKIAPTSLVFGFWDSRHSQFRYGRVLSSTIRATNVAVLKRSAQFNPAIDPATIGLKEAGITDAAKAADEKDPLSQIGLRAAPAVDTHGGVRVYGKIVRRSEINLVALRSLGVIQNGDIREDETLTLRRYILGLALIAARSQISYNLRQGCLLVQQESKEPEPRVVYPTGKREPFTWDAGAVLEYARVAAKDFGVGPSAEYEFQSNRLQEALEEKQEERAAKKTERGKKKTP